MAKRTTEHHLQQHVCSSRWCCLGFCVSACVCVSVYECVCGCVCVCAFAAHKNITPDAARLYPSAQPGLSLYHFYLPGTRQCRRSKMCRKGSAPSREQLRDFTAAAMPVVQPTSQSLMGRGQPPPGNSRLRVRQTGRVWTKPASRTTHSTRRTQPEVLTTLDSCCTLRSGGPWKAAREFVPRKGHDVGKIRLKITGRCFSVVFVYTPTLQRSDADKDQLYDNLNALVAAADARYELIIMEDHNLNASVGIAQERMRTAGN